MGRALVRTGPLPLPVFSEINTTQDAWSTDTLHDIAVPAKGYECQDVQMVGNTAVSYS
jgi:hypothetical protein